MNSIAHACVDGISNPKQYKEIDGTSFDARTPDDLCRMLNLVRNARTRVQVVYGDTATGVKWDESFPNAGTIGRSAGSVKVPLLIKTKRSMGGEALLDHCIIFVKESPGKRTLWKHPKLASVG